MFTEATTAEEVWAQLDVELSGGWRRTSREVPRGIAEHWAQKLGATHMFFERVELADPWRARETQLSTIAIAFLKDVELSDLRGGVPHSAMQVGFINYLMDREFVAFREPRVYQMPLRRPNAYADLHVLS